MSAHDRYLAAYSSHHVHAICSDCGTEWDDSYVSEYGTGWLTDNEQCPKCGSSNIETFALSDYDSSERKAEANGLI